MSKKTRLVALMLVLAMILSCFAACGGETAEEGGNEAAATGYKDTVLMRYGGDLDTAYPYGSTSAQCECTSNLIFDFLCHNNDETGNLDPALATEWTDVNGDGTVWNFKLREGVTFHNGNKFTAEDVQFTLEHVKPDSGNADVVKPLTAGGYVKSYEIKGDYEIEMTMNQPYLDFPNYCEFKVLDKESFETLPVEQAELIGTGPYMWNDAERESGVQWVLDRYDNYWAGIEDLHTKKFVVMAIADAETTLNALEAGELDACIDVSAAQYISAQNIPGVAVYSRPGAQSYYMGFNYSVERSNDVEFRQAVSMLIDREAMCAAQFQGVGGEPNYNFCVPSGLGYKAGLSAPKRDLEKAKAYFEAHPIKDKLTIVSYASLKAAMEVIQANFKEIGIEVEVRQIDSAAWTPFKAEQKGYDFFLDYCSYAGALLYNFNRFFYRGGSSNVYGFGSDDYEALQDAVTNAATYDEMIANFGTLQEWCVENLPNIPWGINYKLCVARDVVKGVTQGTTTNRMDWRTWYIEE